MGTVADDLSSSEEPGARPMDPGLGPLTGTRASIPVRVPSLPTSCSYPEHKSVSEIRLAGESKRNFLTVQIQCQGTPGRHVYGVYFKVLFLT